MLEALGVAETQRVVCTRAPSPRALDPMELANAAMDLGIDTEQIDVIDSVPDAVARALEVTPADGEVIVTGSLYTVGVARSVLVPDA